MNTIQMEQNQLNDALYEKMAGEQQEYRARLTAQPGLDKGTPPKHFGPEL